MNSRSVPKKNALIVISVMGQFPEMFLVAQELKKRSHFNPIVYFNTGVGDHSYAALCLSSGIDIIDYHSGYKSHSAYTPAASAESSSLAQSPPAKRRFQKIKKFIKYNLVFPFDIAVELAFFTFRVILKLKRSKKESVFLDQFNIRLMIFAEDSEDYFTPLLIKIGHQKDIKSVVMPYTFANQYEFLEDAFFNDRRVNRSALNFIAGKLFPKWTYNYKGKILLKSFPSIVFSSELFRTAAPNPWVMSSGFSDLVVVESQFMKEYYVAAGIPEQKIIETGYPSLDYLQRVYESKISYKKQLASKLGLDSEKPWIVCAVAPSQWPRLGIGFSAYDEFLSQYISFLKPLSNVEVLFKFHPRNDHDVTKEVCERHGVKFLIEDTVELIGVADAFVASASSTIRWALAIGIPTINYDLYGYDYGDFDSADNYFTALSFDEFKKLLLHVYQKITVSAHESCVPLQSHFAKLDGKAVQRIIELFSRLEQS